MSSAKALPKNGKFVSMNKPVSASSVWEDNNNQYAGGAVNDGKMNSRWAAKDSLASLEMELNPSESFNKISIFEYQDVKRLPDGFSQVRISRIQQYSIEIMQLGKWHTIFLSDELMGDCKVIRFPSSYRADKLRLTVLKATAPPSIYELSVINMPGK